MVTHATEPGPIIPIPSVPSPPRTPQRLDMCGTCLHAWGMAVMVQIRHVPDAVHRKLKMRAAECGMALSDFLLREVSEVANRPTLEEVVERMRRRPRVTRRIDSAALVRAEREARG
jgi:antitoxin FitA